MKLKTLTILAPLALLACASGKVYSEAEIQKMCLDEKRSAEGPTGAASLSTGTSGTSVGLSISLSDKYIRGLDPQAVYDLCIQKYNDHNAQVLAQADN